jgi:hypothetical protein
MVGYVVYRGVIKVGKSTDTGNPKGKEQLVDFGFPPRRKYNLSSSEMLRSFDWLLVKGVSGQHLVPISKRQYGTNRSSRRVGD